MLLAIKKFTDLKYYDQEKNKTNIQNSINYCKHILIVVRTMAFGKGVDTSVTGYGSRTVR
ncbi:MAG: hypothetical protein QNK20_01150 [Aureibaculum sp.]|nr:hypothetical protein [Aureibaculum sp.]